MSDRMEDSENETAHDDPETEGETLELTVSAEGAGDRLDRWVSQELDLSRTRVAALVEGGFVTWNGAPPRKSEPLAEGDQITVILPAPAPSQAEPEDLPLSVIFEDGDLLVVDKAAGMVVHPAPGHGTGTLVNALLYHVRDLSGIGGTLRPGIVHRLDRDTSGLLVVAKNDATHHALSDALKRRQIRRLYRAVSWGHWTETPRVIDAPIDRDVGNRKRMAVVEGGRRAVSHLRVRERWQAADLIDVALETGRTHQIRVHLSHLGHPVVGDSLYGAGWERGMSGPAHAWARTLARKVTRQFLHARKLEFRHPTTGKVLSFESPLPPDLEAAARWARGGKVGLSPNPGAEEG
jgi:23S rRNA pseudouridine1911/1915/1917 synthase